MYLTVSYHYPKAVVDRKVGQVQHVKVHGGRKHDSGDRSLVTQPRGARVRAIAGQPKVGFDVAGFVLVKPSEIRN